MIQKDKSFISIILKMESIHSKQALQVVDLEKYLNLHFEYYEIILILNGVTGLAKEEISSNLQSHLFKNLTILWLKNRSHSENAMLAGIHRSIGDFIFQIPFPNFDFQLSILTDMLAHLRDNHVDVVSAVPQGSTPISSKLFYWVFNSLSVNETALATERILLTSRRAINTASKIRQNLKYFKLLLSQAGYQRTSMTYISRPMSEPTTHAPSAERVELALDLLLNYSALGSRLSFIMSAFMIVFAMAVASYSIYSYLYFNVLSGWTSLMIFLSISFGGVFFMMAILASSVRKLIDLIQNDSTYKLDEIIHFKQ